MSAPSLSNVFSDVYISGNCTVKGTLSSLAGSITSQWTTSGSIIYYTSGNVGVGTAAPVSTFEVTGTGFPGTALTRTAASDNYGVGIQYSLISSAGSFRGYYARAFGGSLGTIATTNQNQANGYFGIDVANAGLFASDTVGYSGVQFYVAPTISVFNTRVGIGTTNPGSNFTVSGGGSFGSGYNAFTAPTGGLIVQGNVGIGTSNPGVNALQVSGNVVTSGFTSNATNTIFNFDTLTVPFVVATQIASTSTAPLQITSNVDLGTGTINVATVVSTTGLMFRNRVINGDMRIDQRNAGVSFTVSAGGAKTYTLDRWWGWCAVGSKFSVQRSTEVPVGQGFTNSALVTSLSAYSTPVGGYYGFGQYIEGYNIADMGFGTASATTMTLSFWARSSLTGTFSVALENGSFNRSYIFNYTISSVNTWQYFTLPFRADTTGTWDSTTGQGLRIWWDLGSSDTTYASTAGAWLAADALRTTGAVSLIGTNAATLYIAGAQVEKGSAATPFEFRPYATELALCQRYYYQITSPTPGSTGVAAQVYAVFGQATGVSATGFWFPLNFPVTMRYPSFNVTNSAASNWQIYNGTSSISATAITVQTDSYTTSSLAFNCTVASGATAGNSYIFRTAGLTGTTTAYIGISCEL